MLGETDDTILLVDDVAAILKCSTAHVRKLIKQGEINGYMVGRSFRIPRENLEAYIDSKIPAKKKIFS